MKAIDMTNPDDIHDLKADETILECLTSSKPTSFFLFAGAGSGKTRSLVTALEEIRDSSKAEYYKKGQKVGVITFTNNACDEIKSRLRHDALFHVSTIHSFAWLLIQGLNNDIRAWLKVYLEDKVKEIEDKEARGRAGTKASIARLNQIASIKHRLEILNSIKEFIYNPDGDNPEVEALSHSEVIKCTASFLEGKPLMQQILVGRFPVLLIDESQDTSKHLMEAFISVQKAMGNGFALGVIGDTMQRIYPDGKEDLGDKKALPPDWKLPVKEMNHRSTRRIIKLVNRIRSTVDEQRQRPRSDKEDGVVRLFLLSNSIQDKDVAEHQVYEHMAEIAQDKKWLEPSEHVKTLALEHRMAARRLGFLPMWNTLDGVSKLQTGLRKGELPGLTFFSNLILPLLVAFRAEDRFRVAAIMRKHSPLLEKSVLKSKSDNQLAQLEKAQEGIFDLIALWDEKDDPTFMDVLNRINDNKILAIPQTLAPFLAAQDGEVDDSDEDDPDKEVLAWLDFLDTPFEQIEPYALYVKGESHFGTHQGVKGLEFDRVCVIIDDHEARGFTFSYEKLLGAKEDKTKRPPAKESSIDKTRRLFYVTCSRARNSLAIAAYTENPEAVKAHVIGQEWFTENEVVFL